MKFLPSLALAAVAATSLHAQAPAGTTRWADSIQVLLSMDQVRLGSDVDQAIALTERVLSVTPNDGVMLHYKGYALYTKASRLMGSGGSEKEIKAMLEEADAALERSASLVKWPETPAVRSAVIGQIIGVSGMMAGMRLGSKADGLMDDAVAMGPDNPRVFMLRGVSAMYKPKMFGGGMDKAERDLKRAIELFANDRPASPKPRWGHAEAWAWLGQVYAAEKRIPEAREAYGKALALVPEYGWVKQQLLPALDKVKS
jgi:tetratricopeptide (TPR) repeat protein